MVTLNKIECMDCLEYLKQIPDDFVDLVVTDPPYNVSQRNDINFNGRKIRKNFGEWDYGFDPLPVLKELKRVLKPNGQIYVFCATNQIPLYMSTFQKDWQFRNLIVWYKTNPAPRLSKTNWVFANEYILYAINNPDEKPGQATFNFPGQVAMHNTIVSGALQGKERLKNAQNQALHPTQKPLAILKKLIEISSNPEDIVLDPFMGVGSTAVAAKELGRRYLGCELSQRYHQIGNTRI